MLKWFKPRHRSMLAIDINATSINVIEISRIDPHCYLKGYGFQRLPSGLINSSSFNDVPVLASYLKKLVSDYSLSAKQVILAVPESAVISKIVPLKKELSPVELEEAVILEAARFISYPLDEVYIDFEILGVSSGEDPTMLDVLIVVSKAEQVNQRLELIKRAGLSASIIDVESYTVERAVRLIAHNNLTLLEKELIVVVNFTSDRARFFLLENMNLLFTQEEYYPAKWINERQGIHVEQLLEQLRQVSYFPFLARQNKVIPHVFLVGEPAHVREFYQKIPKEDFSYFIVNPFDFMKFSEQIDKKRISELASSSLLLAGLALRSPR